MMKNLLRYVIPFLILILVFRFSSFIMFYAIRFWYVSIPLVLYFLYEYRKNKKRREFKRETNLDPHNEVKLKEDPVIEEDKK